MLVFGRSKSQPTRPDCVESEPMRPEISVGTHVATLQGSGNVSNQRGMGQQQQATHRESL